MTGRLETHNAINNLINQDSRFLLITQEHSGVSKARNTGIDKSTGEYILFVDSDDYVNAAEVHFILRDIQYDDELVVFNFTKRKADGEVLEEVSFADRTVGTKKMLIELSKKGFNRYILNVIWNKVYKKSSLIGRLAAEVDRHAADRAYRVSGALVAFAGRPTGAERRRPAPCAVSLGPGVESGSRRCSRRQTT